MSLTLAKETGSTVFTKTGEGINSVEHRDLTRGLSVPLALTQTAIIGQPGALGNDHVKIKVSDSVLDSTSGKIITASVSIDVSIPRNSAYTTQMAKDLVCYGRAFLNLTDQEDAIAAGTLNRS